MGDRRSVFRRQPLPSLPPVPGTSQGPSGSTHQIVDVNQAIAGKAGEGSVISDNSLLKPSLLAQKIKSKTLISQPKTLIIQPRLQTQPIQLSEAEKKAREELRETIIEKGVQMKTGAYLKHLKEETRTDLTKKAQARMDKIHGQTFSILPKNFKDEKIAPRMNHGFAQACSESAGQGSIFIMRGVNPSSLGKGGVLEHPDRYAPKPMTCHAKSSYFGFTKGLVPVNPQFSRPDYVDKEGVKYQQALDDVKHTLGVKMQGTAEGRPLHLKVQINGQECHVYQGTFKGRSGGDYRYQIAIPDKDNFRFHKATTEQQFKYVQQALKDKKQAPYICLYQESGEKWTPLEELDSHIKAHAKNEDLMEHLGFTIEPTLVIGLPAQKEGETPESRGSQQKTERYYVSDYDVYAIAHTGAAASGQDKEIMEWRNHGEIADPRDIEAILYVNAKLLNKGTPEYLKKNLETHFRDFPIQHAAAAAGIVTTNTEGGLEGFAVPDFPLWVVESEGPSQPGNVIRLDGPEDLAAYMINLSTDENKRAEAIFNSKVLDFCVNKLLQAA
jgi:hypothetical protein